MEEIKVNDYVRTKKGEITKVVKIINYIDELFYKGDNIGFLKNEVKKTSSNIIDLIEVGDYVNGYKVEKIEVNRVICIDYCFDCKRYTLATNNPENIKSIVTHEQFNSIKYEVE